MSTQLKLRRDTATGLAATTPTEAEPGYDQTNKRLIVGDGVMPGGVPHGSFADIQAQRFTFGEAILSGSTYAVTLTPPLTTYEPGVGLLIRPNNGNSGAVTINVNGLGPLPLRKLSDGSLVNLEPADLRANRLYPIACDGGVFQLVGGSSGISPGSVGTAQIANGAVTAAKLASNSVGAGAIAASAVRTSEIFWGSGMVSSSRGGNVVLPGGEYGMYPRVTGFGGSEGSGVKLLVGGSGAPNAWIGFESDRGGSAWQRFVRSSPPYDLGDGEIAGTIFLAVDSAGEVLASYSADTPPWINNGPHDPRAHYVSMTGRKFRLPSKRLNVLAALRNGQINASTAEWRLRQEIDGEPDDVGRLRRGELSIDELLTSSAGEEVAAAHLVEIDHAYKNRDMALLPHPFGELPAGATVVLLDPLCDIVCSLLEAQDEGEDLCGLFHRGLIRPDNEALEGRHGPAGVRQVRVRI
ncbi:hypothetical protein ABWI00_21705 [Algihabitans albus]|uniref:hyaluronate lyase N-terminal domain-containing protein n=1 Tax=Algihabitans albus TaxID=2164067 RepID=UPI0035CE8C70